MRFSRKRAVSPIIATLLLIAIAVAAGIIVYVYVNSLAGNLTGSGGNQVSQQVQLQAYNYIPQTVTGVAAGESGQVVDIFLKNVGSSSVSISNIYFDGNQLTEYAYSSGTSYGTNLYVPNSAQSCFALIPTSVTLTYTNAPTTLVSGTSTNCTTYTAAAAVCNTVSTDFCVVSSTATPAETGMTALPLAAQGSAQLVIGLNYGARVTAGTTHTIKIVTTSGGQAVFSIVAGRSG